VILPVISLAGVFTRVDEIFLELLAGVFRIGSIEQLEDRARTLRAFAIAFVLFHFVPALACEFRHFQTFFGTCVHYVCSENSKGFRNLSEANVYGGQGRSRTADTRIFSPMRMIG
jgi:hypothetical protein